MSSGKKTQGRQKVEMKRMTNKSSLKTTFSKRRSGLFKKASELCTLCGADVALVVFSPGKKAYSFGHPNVDTVIDRYISRVPHQNNGTAGLIIEARRNANIHELNSQLTQINNILDIEKGRMDELSQIHNMNEAQYWWARSFDGMNWDQLEFLKNKFENLKNLIAQHPNRHVIQGAPTQTLPFFGVNGSSSNMPLHHQPNTQQPQNFPPIFDGNASSSNMPLHHQPNPNQAQIVSPFFDGNGSSSNMSLHHQPNPQQVQIFPPFFYGNGSSSNMSLHHQSSPQQTQILSEQFFENPMLQPHLFGFNNMGGGGGGGYGPS
ncbi:unnamed protein product [Trifolium pratense]|uniref:Uncharacterized protein n=1 Tax=Trifolium pratense TaxID=57577 RepID=A0ACB0JUV2_TRIPR|nr:unnamed protein product [Trifolium pratense]